MSKSYKSVSCTGTVSSLNDAIADLTALGEECREIVDNAPPGLADTQRIQTFEETASSLESVQDLDIPEVVTDLAIGYIEQRWSRKRGGPSRAVRCENACAVLWAAQGALEEWLDDDANEEHDDRDEVEQLMGEIADALSYAEDAEFPGMFG